MEEVNRSTLKADVEHRISENNVDIQKAETKFAEDYKGAISWGYAESKYKAVIRNEKLSKLLDYIDNKPEKLTEWVDYSVGYITEQIFRNQSIVVGGSYWSRMCTLMENETLVWWVGYIKAVQKYIERNQPIK